MSIGGEPDGIDANHRNRSRRKVAQAEALSVGQFTLMVPRGCWISMHIFDDAACELAPANGMDTSDLWGRSDESRSRRDEELPAPIIFARAKILGGW